MQFDEHIFNTVLIIIFVITAFKLDQLISIL